ncbi:unnamed protein product [Ectocarpus sp. CCAP 1310/34]|nr:unnamed protein product [Ectocarpus sp. CCAP 1310/34]
MWRVLKKMTVCTRRAVMLDGELSKFFDIEQGVPQGCTLSPTLFQVFINDLLEVVEAVRKGVKAGDTETSVSGMLFADDFVEDLWKGLDIDEDETLETEGLQGFKEKISVACAEREEQNLRKESKDKEGLQVSGMLEEGIRFKDYLHGLMDAGTKLKVKFRTGDIGLRERRRRHRTVDEEDDEFKCDCGFECEDRVHVVAECPLYKKEREVYVTELGKTDRTHTEMFEAWNREERTVAVLGHRRWVEKAGRDIVRIDRLIGKTLLSHLWRSRKERLAIGDRSCGNNAPSSRGRVVNGLTAKTCKT